MRLEANRMGTRAKHDKPGLMTELSSRFGVWSQAPLWDFPRLAWRYAETYAALLPFLLEKPRKDLRQDRYRHM